MTNIKKISFAFFTLLFLVISISLCYAHVQVSYPSNGLVSLNSYNPSYNIEFENLNNSESVDVSLSLSSSLDSVVQLSSSSVQDILSKKSVTISLLSSLSSGYYEGGLNWLDSGNPQSNGEVQISVVVDDEKIYDNDIVVFPTSKVVTVQQGSQKVQNIMISVPESYSNPITIQSVDFNPGTETIYFEDLNLGQVMPGNSIQLPVVFSGIDAQTGNYQTQLNIFATDSSGQVQLPSVSLSLQVTSGITTITSDTFSTPPTCSLSATTLNLNNTYSFVCSGIVSNLNVDIPSSEYYIGKNVEISSGIYSYDFMPIKYGETTFKADFRYNGASIFEPFKQDIRISSSGSLVAGTDLKFVFTPKLGEATGEEERFLIQLVDNKTGSLVLSPRVWINALELNSTSDTFSYKFIPGMEYEIRGKSSGYEDIVELINFNPSKIEIKISPDSGDTFTTFTINSSVINSTILVNGAEYNNTFIGKLKGGVNEIKAIKERYKTEIINFTVNDNPKVISSSSDKFKKGVEQIFTLSQESDWVVYYKKDLDSLEEIEHTRGTSSVVTFTPKKKGTYTIKEDNGYSIATYQTESFSINKKLLGLKLWIWAIIVLSVFIVCFIIIIRNSGGQSIQDKGSEFQFNAGGDL